MSENFINDDMSYYDNEVDNEDDNGSNADFWETQNKIKKRVKIAIISLALVIVICISVFAFNYFYVKKSYESVASLVNLPEPNQQEATGEFVKQIDEYEIKFEIKANYVLNGRVVEKYHYQPFTIVNKLSEYDLGIVWGKLLGEDLEDMNFRNNGNRFLQYRYSQSFTEKMGGKEAIINSLSNNHIIPSEERILKCLRNLKEDDFIKLEGYLVDVTYTNIYNSYSANWTTSLSRTDHGDGACEVFYVTNLVWLKEQK